MVSPCELVSEDESVDAVVLDDDDEPLFCDASSSAAWRRSAASRCNKAAICDDDVPVLDTVVMECSVVFYPPLPFAPVTR